jgi:hypothetical protein
MLTLEPKASLFSRKYRPWTGLEGLETTNWDRGTPRCPRPHHFGTKLGTPAGASAAYDKPFENALAADDPDFRVIDFDPIDDRAEVRAAEDVASTPEAPFIRLPSEPGEIGGRLGRWFFPAGKNTRDLRT